MHIPTIYNPKISDKDTIFALDTEKHHHLKNVLRIKDDTKVKISMEKERFIQVIYLIKIFQSNLMKYF